MPSNFWNVQFYVLAYTKVDHWSDILLRPLNKVKVYLNFTKKLC